MVFCTINTWEDLKEIKSWFLSEHVDFLAQWSLASTQACIVDQGLCQVLDITNMIEEDILFYFIDDV